MIYIEYCKDGTPISDFKIEEWIKEVIRDKNLTIAKYKICNSLPFLAIQLAISKKYLDSNNVIFIFNKKEFQTDKYGFIERPPNGFLGKELKYSSELCKNTSKRLKKEQIKAKT